MAKFNSRNSISPVADTVNSCGYEAYSMADREKLLTQVLTSFFNEQKFYGDNSDEIEEVVDRVIKQDPAFVSKLAVFARREFNMRSISHVLTAHLAHAVEGKPYVRSTVRGITLRGDDVTELTAFYLEKYGKPIPNSLKKGIAEVLKGFDEYTLAKYKGAQKSVKMKDLLSICHPKPKSVEQAELWKRCLEGSLEIPETWETELSAHGNTRETWEKLIRDGKLGYMAMLRNLRNILKTEPENINLVFDKLRDPVAVKKSRQLPFRFLSAYREIGGCTSASMLWRYDNGDPRKPIGLYGSKALDVLEDAFDASIENLPKIPGRTVIAIDVSGSMCCPISQKSTVRSCDIAMLLGMIANRICEDSIVFTFDTSLKKLAVSHRDGILGTVTRYDPPGWGTDMHLPFQAMTENRLPADRIIILSDNECNRGLGTVQRDADAYRKLTGNNIWVHAVDLSGYGTQQFTGRKFNLITGWSEKVFDFILLAESGVGNLEKAVSEYSW